MKSISWLKLEVPLRGLNILDREFDSLAMVIALRNKFRIGQGFD